MNHLRSRYVKRALLGLFLLTASCDSTRGETEPAPTSSSVPDAPPIIGESRAPSSHIAAIHESGSIHLMSVAEGQLVAEFDGPKGNAVDVAASGDVLLLGICCEPVSGQLWVSERAQPAWRSRLGAQYLAVSRSGKVAFSDTQAVRIIDIADVVTDAAVLSPTLVAEIEGGASTDLSWVGEDLLAFDSRRERPGSVRIVNLDGTEAAVLASDTGFERPTADEGGRLLVAIEQCCWTFSGAMGASGEIVVFEVATFQELTRLEAPGFVLSASMSGTVVALVLASGELRTIDIATSDTTSLGFGFTAASFVGP